jgi:hypothetical protein
MGEVFFFHEAFDKGLELRAAFLVKDYCAVERRCSALDEAHGWVLVKSEPEFPGETVGGERDSVSGLEVVEALSAYTSAVLS